MRKSKVLSFCLALLSGALVLAGCSSSSSDKSVGGSGPENLRGATVFLDQNGDLALNPGEVSTQTSEEGRYKLGVDPEAVSGKSLVLMVDEDTVWSDTGIAPETRFTLVSLPGEPKAISIFTTLLATQSTYDEAGLKTRFGISEDASLVSGYAADGEIDVFLRHATKLYGDMFASSAEVGATPQQRLDGTVQVFIEDSSLVADYVADIVANEPLPPTNEAPSTSVIVGQEIFQSIPVDAATMSFGVGMDEITRKVVSGSYCLDVPEASAIPELAISQNTRTYLFRLVQSEKDLRELLNVGGGLDIGTSMVQGSMEGRFINEFRSDKSAVFALIKAEYILSGYKLFGVGLADNYLVNDPNVASYVSNYSAFRNACGDRYLDQVTTGGAYYGLLKINTDSSASKKDLTVSLEGKYGKGPVSVSVRGDLQSRIEESVGNKSIDIIIGSRGVSPEYLGLTGTDNQLIDTLDDFFNAADQFIDAISDGENECHDDSIAYKKCAYTATFADYATISGGVPRFQKQVENLNFTTKLMGQYEDYKILENFMSTMMVKRLDYDWTEDCTPENSTDTPCTPADIYKKKSQISRGKSIMDAAFRKCTTDFTGCTDNPEAQSLQSFNEVLNNLPFEAWREPRDCRDIQRLLGNEDVEEAIVALGGDPLKLFQVSCYKMDTSEPETYLDIFSTSGSPDSLSYNMARNVNPDGSTVSSKYDKIRVNVNFNNLEIINEQPDLQETLSTAADDSPTKALNFTQARMGTAVDCYAQPGEAITNIDLIDTGFKFSPDLTFVVDAHPITKYEWVAEAKNWDDAKAYAESKGGHLVVLNSVAEFNKLVKLLKEKKGNPDHSWVGLKRTDMAQPAQYQQFEWVGSGDNLTGKEVADYFYAGEPNNWRNVPENCVQFRGASNYGQLLNDISCTYSFPFLIEYDIAAPSGALTLSADKKSLDGWVNGTVQGQCVEARPAQEAIRLVYDEL
jgi:hypothetical protein